MTIIKTATPKPIPMKEKIEKLKTDLIGNFVSTEIDQKALKKFFSSIKKNI